MDSVYFQEPIDPDSFSISKDGDGCTVNAQTLDEGIEISLMYRGAWPQTAVFPSFESAFSRLFEMRCMEILGSWRALPDDMILPYIKENGVYPVRDLLDHAFDLMRFDEQFTVQKLLGIPKGSKQR